MPFSDFDTRFTANARPHMIERFGEDVTYTPTNGVGVTVKALVFKELDSDSRETRTYAVSAADVAASQPNDQITDLDGRAWLVDPEGIEQDIGGLRLLTCSRAQLHSHTG